MITGLIINNKKEDYDKDGNIIAFYGALKDSKDKLEIIKRKIKERRNEIDNEVSKKIEGLKTIII